MPKMARLVVPGYPHHVTQRGSRRQTTFFGEPDYKTYVNLLASHRVAAGVEVWAYCLMPNHVHLVLVPREADSLARLLRDTHSTYARHVNAIQGWCGHLWQERFHSVVMDEAHLLAAVRYVELNPVRASLCRQATDWPWSSARAHLLKHPDNLMPKAPMLDRIDDWQAYLSRENSKSIDARLRRLTSSGRPAGSDEFIRNLEALTGRTLARQKPGPKTRN